MEGGSPASVLEQIRNLYKTETAPKGSSGEGRRVAEQAELEQVGILPAKYSHSRAPGLSPCSTLKNLCRWLGIGKETILEVLDSALCFYVLSHSTWAGWRIPPRDSKWSGSIQALGRICRHIAHQYSSLGTPCSPFTASSRGAGLTWADQEFFIPLCFPNLETGRWRRLTLHTYCVPSISTSFILFYTQ